MSDTETNWDGPGPAIILVEPQLGENIGAAARAMWNFGLRDLRIVAPRDGWPNGRAQATASGADIVLENAQIHATTRDAVAEMNVVFATTARPREMIKTVMTPERAAEHMKALIDGGQKVGILFGKERTGLENDDVVLADTIITVPVNPKFHSLNLAQCVLLVANEWRRQIDRTTPETLETGRAGLARHEDRERMLDFLESALTDAGFWYPVDKAPAMKATLRNAFSRQPLTDADVRMLWGVFRALRWKEKGRG